MLILVNCICCDNKIKYGERKRIVCGGINREVKEEKRRVGLVNNRKNVDGWMEGKEKEPRPMEEYI